MRILILLCALASMAAAQWRPPAGNRPASRRPGAESVLPGGRVITPLGRQFSTGPGPFAIAASRDGKFVVTSDGGPNRYSFTFLDLSAELWQVRSVRAKRRDDKTPDDDDDFRSVFLGLAFDRRGALFASEGNSGAVRHIAVPSGRLLHSYQLNQGGFSDSYSSDLTLDEERGLLYVLDQANFRVAIFSTRSRRLLASARTGRLPFKMALSADRRRLWVANIGMFQYQPVPGADPKAAKETGLPFPAFGFPSKESESGVRLSTERGPVDVPPLGDPNLPESNSVAAFDVSDPARPQLLGFTRTGEPFGPASHGGSSPSGIAVTPRGVYVSNANQDTLTVLDPVTRQTLTTIALRIPGLEAFRGVLPIGLTFHPPTGWLLVAEAGINAVAVVDTRTDRVLGHVPSAWFPTSVAAHGEEIFVSCAKGHGTGPNASKSAPLEQSFQADLRQGAISVFSLPPASELPALTARVMANNGFVARKEPDGPLPGDIKYVVLIVKENRTYDEVFGDLDAASNGPLNGAPELARFGQRGWVTQDRNELLARLSRRYVNVTPNHHQLARRFAFSDNFYADSEVSVDGHHWLVGSYPNAWTESSLMAAYGGQKDFRLNPSAPGRLLFAQSNSSLHPEEQLEAGAIWHHLERHGIRFRNFGEGFELAGVDESAGLLPTGARFLTNVPMPNPLWLNTSRDYPQYNMNIPDQYRASAFIDEIEALYSRPNRDLPQFLFIHLPNDHMARVRPEDGYPFQASYVVDNDYALGRIVEYLSHSRWWPKMAIFVTEDDAQGGVDHVDSHRSILLAASPYARRNYASHANASFPALLKTVFRLLSLPPLNLYDATAADLSNLFTTTPDFEPFELQPVELEIFNPKLAKDPADPEPSPRMDDPSFLRRQHRTP